MFVRSQASGKLDISIFEYARCIIKFTHRHRAHRHSIDSIVLVPRFSSFFAFRSYRWRCLGSTEYPTTFHSNHFWVYRTSPSTCVNTWNMAVASWWSICLSMSSRNPVICFIRVHLRYVCVCVSKSINKPFIFGVSFEFKTDSIAGSLLRKRFQSGYITLATNNAERSLQCSTHILYEEIGDRCYSIRCENLFGCQDNPMKWRANKNPWNEQNQSDEFYSIRDMAWCICILRLFV